MVFCSVVVRLARAVLKVKVKVKVTVKEGRKIYMYALTPTKGEVVKLAPTTFDRCGRWFESQCRHTLSVLGGFG